MVQIQDESHGDDFNGQFPTFAHAMAELQRRSKLAWDAEPNRAPCTGWKKCRRKYAVVEYDDSAIPFKELRRLRVLEISSQGVVWTENVEQQWANLAN
jgi:hypothetical protein